MKGQNKCCPGKFYKQGNDSAFESFDLNVPLISLGSPVIEVIFILYHKILTMAVFTV
jgi:hypothetical protein